MASEVFGSASLSAFTIVPLIVGLAFPRHARRTNIAGLLLAVVFFTVATTMSAISDASDWPDGKEDLGEIAAFSAIVSVFCAGRRLLLAWAGRSLRRRRERWKDPARRDEIRAF